MIHDVGFNRTEIMNFTHDTECIYILAIRDSFQYIGQTKNLRKRLISHLKEDLFENITHILILPIKDKELRYATEHELIYNIKPELNKKFVHYEPK